MMSVALRAARAAPQRYVSHRRKTGCIVIPAYLADEIADKAVEMTAFEDFVSEKVHKGRSIMGLYPPTDPQAKADFEVWREAKGR
jgi:hypothetical protein